MTITSHRAAETPSAAATLDAPPSTTRGARAPRATRAGALAVEVSSLLGRVRSATSSPSGLHLMAGLVVTSLGAAATALLLAPA